MPAEPAVMVTRPAGQGERLCSLLRGAGFTPVHEPLIELQPLERPHTESGAPVTSLEDWDALIFVSANAVHFGMPWLLSCGAVAGRACFAVGASTREALAGFGVEAQAPASEMTSEGLLALPGLRDIAGRRILIVKGEGGRGLLRQRLRERGAVVAELACYRRLAPPRNPGEMYRRLREQGVGTLLVSSGEGLQNLLACLGEGERRALSDVLVVVPSPRIAEQARQAGFDRLSIARNASDEAMLAALQAHGEGRGEQRGAQ